MAATRVEDRVYEATRRVFCEGTIIEAVHKYNIFADDSKTFVDKPLREDPEAVLASFAALLQSPSGLTEASVRRFLDENFGDPGTELVPHTPEDYTPEPPKELLSPLRASSAPDALERWARALHSLWLVLCRRVRPEVMEHPSRYTLLPRIHPFVVPGGRFRESYYWDSYWIVQGLLASGMATTARQMVENLLDDVLKYGFCPNGSRLYYLNRSQPPLLSEMVMALVADGSTAGPAWLKSTALPALDAEYNFWMRGSRCVRVRAPGEAGQVHKLNRYFVANDMPRPESWPEDDATARGLRDNTSSLSSSLPLPSPSSRAAVFGELASAAESGWDFSSRWMQRSSSSSGGCVGGSGGSDGDWPLWRTKIRSNVPVDLNAILYRMEQNMGRAHRLVATGSGHGGERERHFSSAETYEAAAAKRAAAFEAILWRDWAGRWTDAWLVERGAQDGGVAEEFEVDEDHDHRRPVFASDYLPLWAGLTSGAERASVVLASILASGLICTGGIQTSTALPFSKQQWDAPNVWAPLVGMIVEGLEKVPFSVAERPGKVTTGTTGTFITGPRLAFEVARLYLESARAAHEGSGWMYEKYSATEFGQGGGGGEYEPQVGFGWSNGVALHLLQRYGASL